MMGFFESFGGEVTLKVTSAAAENLLTALSENGIRITDVRIIDELTVVLCVSRKDSKNAQQIIRRKGGDAKTVRRKGLYYLFRRFLHRPVLVIGIVILFLAMTMLPTRIFFFRVEGNGEIPAKRILEQASQCGISFGASRREVRSENMKNKLLQAMPELQWAGVNTYGCVAVISVEPREIADQDSTVDTVSRIVANRDGVILSVTATKGNPLCAVGQAVKRGEVLISGYTDCGISIRATRSVGEVYARTQQQLTAVTPAQYSVQQIALRQERKYALLIGKKRINFYKGSGILPDTCDRMYEENYMTLPGGFQLPVAIVEEVWTYYDCAEGRIGEADASALLGDSAAAYLTDHMIAGQILSKNETISPEEDYYILTGHYACYEMIGREQTEEIIAPYGKHD